MSAVRYGRWWLDRSCDGWKKWDASTYLAFAVHESWPSSCCVHHGLTRARGIHCIELDRVAWHMWTVATSVMMRYEYWVLSTTHSTRFFPLFSYYRLSPRTRPRIFSASLTTVSCFSLNDSAGWLVACVKRRYGNWPYFYPERNKWLTAGRQASISEITASVVLNFSNRITLKILKKICNLFIVRDWSINRWVTRYSNQNFQIRPLHLPFLRS